MHDGKNPDVMWVCVFILHNKSLGSCFRTLLLWQRLHPELCIDTCCYTCTYTHTYTCTLPSLLEKLGLKLAGYYRFYLFTLGFCHFLVNHCYLFRAHSVYWGFTPAFSGFYSTLTQFLNWVFCCFFMYLCVEQDLNKRLSLPADIRIPDGYLEKLQLSSPPFDQPLSRRSRRASLVRCTHSCADTTLKKNLKTWLSWKVVVLRNLADLWMFKCNGKYKSNWTTSVCGPVTNQLPVIHLSLSPHAISSLHSCLFVVVSVSIEHNGLIHQKLLNGQLSV